MTTEQPPPPVVDKSVEVKQALDILRYDEQKSFKLSFELIGVLAKDSDYAEEFIEQGGLGILMSLLKVAKGAFQGYVLGAVRSLLLYVSAIDEVAEKPEIIDRLYVLLATTTDDTRTTKAHAPSSSTTGGVSLKSKLTVQKQVLEILIVLCGMLEEGHTMIHKVAKAKRGTVAPYSYLASLLLCPDLLVVRNALTFLNILLTKRKEESDKKLKKLVFYLETGGVLSSVKQLVVVEDEMVKKQITVFQKLSNVTVPLSFYEAMQWKKKCEDLQKQYDQINEQLFYLRQQQPKYCLMKKELARSREALEALSVLCNTSTLPHPTSRADVNGGSLAQQYAAYASSVVCDLSDVKECETVKRIRLSIATRFLDTPEFRGLAAAPHGSASAPTTAVAHAAHGKKVAGSGEGKAAKSGGALVSIGDQESDEESAGGGVVAASDSDEDELPPPSDDEDELPPPSDDEDAPPPASDDEDAPPRAVAAAATSSSSAKKKKPEVPALHGASDTVAAFPPPPVHSLPSDAPSPEQGYAVERAPAMHPAQVGHSSSTEILGSDGVHSSAPLPDPATSGGATRTSTLLPPTLPPVVQGAPTVPVLPVGGNAILPPPPRMGGNGIAGMPPPPPIGGKLPPPPGVLGKMPTWTSPSGTAVSAAAVQYWKGPAPQKKMRVFHWDKLPLIPDSSKTLWGAIHTGEVDCSYNYEEFEAMFSQKETTTQSKRVVEAKIDLMETKKFSNISIMLYKLPTIPQIQRGILDLDDDLISRESLEALIAQAPSAEDVRMFNEKRNAKPVETYAPPEQFFAMAIATTEFERRCSTWLFVRDWNDNLHNAQKPIAKMATALRDVRQSKSLPYILGIILGFGNMMNYENKLKGNAPAFHYTTLSKLDALKDKSGKLSLLNYLIMTIQNANPAALDFPEEVKACLNNITSIKTEDMEKSVLHTQEQFTQFMGQVKQVQAVLEQEGGDDVGTNAAYVRRMMAFQEQAQTQIKALQESYEEILKNFHGILSWWSCPEDKIKSIKIEDFFAEFVPFVMRFKALSQELIVQNRKRQTKRGKKLEAAVIGGASHAANGNGSEGPKDLEDVLGAIVNQLQEKLVSG